MTRPPPPFLSATHVTYDPYMPKRLSKLGAKNIVRACHALIIAPSQREVMVHAVVRKAWWHSASFKKWDDLYSFDVRWETPVVLWVSRHIVERVNLWRTCSWLRHLGIPIRDVLILEFDPVPSARILEEDDEEVPLPLFDTRRSVPDHSDDVLLERLRTARPWPRARYNRAVRLWNQYLDANPSRFVRSCTQGVEDFPELASLWTFLSAFFPRRTSDGALRLSHFDKLLLMNLSDEWRTSVQVLCNKSEASYELWDYISGTGDLITDERLAQWARHGSGAVERAPGPGPPDHLRMSSVYRLTDIGRRLRDEGLQQLLDAPPLAVGGIQAYSSRWVLSEGGQLVRL